MINKLTLLFRGVFYLCVGFLVGVLLGKAALLIIEVIHANL